MELVAACSSPAILGRDMLPRDFPVPACLFGAWLPCMLRLLPGRVVPDGAPHPGPCPTRLLDPVVLESRVLRLSASRPCEGQILVRACLA